MRAALLCPGPSLAAYAPSGHDIVIAVNRAAELFPCDAWSAMDITAIKRSAGKTVTRWGDLSLLTIKATGDSVARRGWTFKSVATHGGEYSAIAALSHLIDGGYAIDVYGADMTGDGDWDGTQAGENRSETRWAKEARLWNKLAEGREVIRHGIDERRN